MLPITVRKRQRRDSDASEGRSSKKHSQPSPHARLSNALLLRIFEAAAGYRSPFTTIAISQVCRAWRHLARATPSLWSDTSHVASLCTEAKENSAEIGRLLDLCSRRSQNSLTHVDISSLVARQGYLDTIRGSSKTLVDLGISDRTWCGCFPWPWAGITGQHAPQDIGCSNFIRRVGLKYEEVMQFVAEACCNLEHLSVELTLKYNIPWAPETPEAIVQGNLPKLKTLTVDLDMGLPPPPYQTALQWLDRLAAEVRHLTCTVHLHLGAAKQWVTRTVSEKASGLRSLRLYIPMAMFPMTNPLEMPHLEQLTVCYPKRCTDVEATFRPSLGVLRAPALRGIRTLAAFSYKVQCPQVLSASLIVSHTDDVEALPSSLAAWPLLETLTIQLESDTTRRPKRTGRANTQALRDVLRILTEVDAATDNVLVPSLRHLGIVFRCPEKRGAAVEDNIEWAAKAWTSDEEQHQYQDFFPDEDGIGFRNPSLGAALDLDRVEAQRRRLASRARRSLQTGLGPHTQGSGGRLSREAAVPHCVPLERIKLAGIHIDPEDWNSLKETSQVRLLCYPEPRALEQEPGSSV